MLTHLQAFNATREFLSLYYKKTLSDDVAVLWGGLQFIQHGYSADPAAWYDWMETVGEVMHVNGDTILLTEIEAFNLMKAFFKIYYKRGCPPDGIVVLLKDLEILSDGKAADQAVWQDWMNAVTFALENTTMLSNVEAFKAMREFLAEYVKKNSLGKDTIELALYDLEIFEGSKIRDMQTWYDWMNVLAEFLHIVGTNIFLFTSLQGFTAMKVFLTKHYYKENAAPLDDIGPFLRSLEILPDGKTADRTILYDWMRLVDQVIAQEKN